MTSSGIFCPLWTVMSGCGLWLDSLTAVTGLCFFPISSTFLSLLFLPSSAVSLSYFNLSVLLCTSLGEQLCMSRPLEFVFQEQSYSSFHSGRSLAWDHVRGNIDDSCGANSCWFYTLCIPIGKLLFILVSYQFSKSIVLVTFLKALFQNGSFVLGIIVVCLV